MDRDEHGNQTRARPKTWKNIQQSFYGILREHPKLQYVLYALIILIVIFLYFGWPEKKQENPTDSQGVEQVSSNAAVEESDNLESRLTQTLERIQGVGRVEVLINYESSSEVVPAMSVEKQNSSGESGIGSGRESSEPFTMQGDEGEGPLVLMEIEPQIRGVIIVAEGASDLSVRMQLQTATQTALGIPASKVEVFPMAEAEPETNGTEN